jgi:hypothetical protein
VDPRALLEQAYRAAVAAADPLHALAAHLPAPCDMPAGRTLAVGAGKAAASMALALERHWPTEAPLSGLVVTRYAHGLPCRRIEVVEAGHPMPDESGERAASRIACLAADLGPEDLLVALISGGGSSLLALPVPGVPMAQVAPRAWTVGTAQETSPTSVEPTPPKPLFSNGTILSQSGKSISAGKPWRRKAETISSGFSVAWMSRA